jgi:hypothetical protein
MLRKGCRQMQSGISRSITISAATIILLLAGYALSVGPVFAYHCHHADDESVRSCRYYQPLFRDNCRDVTTAYLRLWNVSELEAFVLLSMARCDR